MADIFISYSKREAEITAELANDLEQQGYTTWWDTRLLPGDHFRDTIKQQIDAAKAVIVIWTPLSVLSKWVYAEAQMADHQNKLITISSEKVDPQNIPLPFNSYYTTRLDERQKILFACRQYVDIKSAPVPPMIKGLNNLPSVITESINKNHQLDDIILFANNILSHANSSNVRIRIAVDIHEADTRYTIHPNGDTYVESRFHLNSAEGAIYFWTYWIDADRESDSIQFLNQLRFKATDAETGLSLDWLPTRDESKLKTFAIFLNRINKKYVEIQISYWWKGYSKKLFETGEIKFTWRYSSGTPNQRTRFRSEWKFIKTEIPIIAKICGRQSATALLRNEKRGDGAKFIYEDPDAMLSLHGYSINFST